DTVWQKAKSLGDQINTPYNEGAMHLSTDGTSLFFTSCRGMQGYGSCDLYYAARINDTVWKEPFNLGPVINTRHWETQPCCSSDGKTLYFVSTREGGEGGADIWRSRLQDNSEWSEPENLGPEINTKGEEMAPYLHPDGVTLYFSSNGHRGMGGMDIFVSRMNPDSSWSEPENFGYPVNDRGDQINLIVDAEGKTVYFSSKDTSGYGCYDIYSFEMPQKHKPEPVAYLKGTVYDKKTRDPVQAHFELIDLKRDESKVSSRSDNQGNFMVALPNGRNYALHVNKKGYLFYSEHFPLEQQTTKPVEKDIYLEPISIKASSRLDNLFFVFDSDSIRQESVPELKQLKEFMDTNPHVEIRIEGHTDNTGEEEYNKRLSQKRAEAVKAYLKENGIEEDRLSTKGFGESKPVADNSTEQGRARNRRTEIQITAHLKTN
ncbi:MAG: OmpA family protein, partial [Bacteroidota bacterium]